MALPDMTILPRLGVCSDCGDRPDPGRSSHRLALLEEIYSAAVRDVKHEQNFFLHRCFGTETSSSGGVLQPAVRPEPGDISRSGTPARQGPSLCSPWLVPSTTK